MSPFLAGHLKGNDLTRLDRALNNHLNILANRKKDVEEVFELLGLHETGDEVLQSPLYYKWDAFVQSRYHDKTEAFVAMFPVLAKYIKGNDLTRLEHMLDSKLEGGANNLKQAATIFKLLRLHLADGNVYHSKLYQTWYAFSTARYSDKSEAFFEIFPFLAGHLIGNDLTELDHALETHLNMLGSEENKVAVLFKLLKLHLTNGKVFQSPVYNKWITFVASRYADDNAAFAAMFPFLAKYLKGDELVKLLVSGLKLKKTKISATRRLKKETKKLIKSWVDSGKDEAYVFELLGLDSERKTNNIHLKNLWKSFVRAKQDKPSRE